MIVQRCLIVNAKYFKVSGELWNWFTFTKAVWNRKLLQVFLLIILTVTERFSLKGIHLKIIVYLKNRNVQSFTLETASYLTKRSNINILRNSNFENNISSMLKTLTLYIALHTMSQSQSPYSGPSLLQLHSPPPSLQSSCQCKNYIINHKKIYIYLCNISTIYERLTNKERQRIKLQNSGRYI